MVSQFIKAFTILALNTLMIVGLLMGFGVIQEAAIALFESTGQTLSTFKATIAEGVTFLFSLDPLYFFGVIFCVGVISYDVVLIYSWLRTVSFTTSKYCNNCRNKIIREPRKPIDRFISLMISLKRYRCIGCGKEYLKVQRLIDNKQVTAGQEQPVYVRRD